MQTSAPIGPPEEETDRTGRAVNRLLAYLPRGNTLDHKSWQRRHQLLKWVLAIHLPAMAVQFNPESNIDPWVVTPGQPVPGKPNSCSPGGEVIECLVDLEIPARDPTPGL